MSLVATFSIVARDPASGDLGVAVQSKFLAVGSVVPWARAGVGAVATQALANIRFGPDGLDLLAQGLSAEAALERLLAEDPQREHRQLALVDDLGRAVAFTGEKCHSWAGHRVGEGFAAQGNILTGPEVVDAMVETFLQSSGELAERLAAALDAGQGAGGDSRGRQSAALYVARAGGSYGGNYDRYVDLRVDDHPDPIVELRRLLALHRFYLTPPSSATLVPLDEPVVSMLQAILSDLGFYQGRADGRFDEVTREALITVGGIENLEERLVGLDEGKIDPQVLSFLRRKRDEVLAARNQRPE